MKTTKTLTLANPRGFCAGVDRAINIVEKALASVDTISEVNKFADF